MSPLGISLAYTVPEERHGDAGREGEAVVPFGTVAATAGRHMLATDGEAGGTMGRRRARYVAIAVALALSTTAMGEAEAGPGVGVARLTGVEVVTYEGFRARHWLTLEAAVPKGPNSFSLIQGAIWLVGPWGSDVFHYEAFMSGSDARGNPISDSCPLVATRSGLNLKLVMQCSWGQFSQPVEVITARVTLVKGPDQPSPWVLHRRHVRGVGTFTSA
jgi:hypothetical protein